MIRGALRHREGVEGFVIRLIVDWFVLTVSLGLTAWFLPGVQIESLSALLWAGTALGLANLVLRPLLHLVSLPFRLLTFGLFSLVVNGVVFWVAAALVPGFSVGKDLVTAILGALVVSVIAWVLGDLGYRRQRAKRAAQAMTSSTRQAPVQS